MKTELTLDERESFKHSKKDYLIRTAMSKAEEIFKKVWVSHFGHSKQLDADLNIALEHDYIFEAMQQYADEVSRESIENYAKFVDPKHYIRLIQTYELWKSKFPHCLKHKEIYEFKEQEEKK